MQQTNQYQFNLIESGDTFSPQPLNENMEKVEATLASQQENLNAAKKELQQKIGDYLIFGSYVGDDKTNRFIDLGFTPRFVLIMGSYPGTDGTLGIVAFLNAEYGFIVSNTNQNIATVAHISEGGFVARTSPVNTKGYTSYYLALK